MKLRNYILNKKKKKQKKTKGLDVNDKESKEKGDEEGLSTTLMEIQKIFDGNDSSSLMGDKPASPSWYYKDCIVAYAAPMMDDFEAASEDSRYEKNIICTNDRYVKDVAMTALVAITDQLKAAGNYNAPILIQ